MEAEIHDLYNSAARALYWILWGVGWLCTVVGWIMLLASAVVLSRPLVQGRPSPWSSALKMFVGGIAVLQAEKILTWISGSIVGDVVLFGKWKLLDAETNLKEWFSLDMNYKPTDDAWKQVAIELAYGVSAIGGYCFFIWGLSRLIRAGSADGNGRQITLSSGIATLLGGVALVHLPFFVETIWSDMKNLS